ncbi:maleylpyruvate isomerase family mycothiol-dependent enzyme [Nocardioides sp. MH1]|uniref:maleylpyruvate isomerase family mycothiol-dependent enzyme n=1 Tax=Nocardioides sp. MH1 TaxID=3242490 RepID=UPI003520D3BA
MTDLISAATERLLTTVHGLADGDWAAPSTCLGWSRAHVLAHLALNAEALAGVARGLAAGEQPNMYPSDTVRDADIEQLAQQQPAVVRERLQVSTVAFADALPRLAAAAPGATFERTPGGAVMAGALVPLLRLREVEIHHADLDAGYGYDDWPAATAIAFADLDSRRYAGAPFAAVATDLGLHWSFGSVEPGSPVLSGPAAGIAWLATGRDPGATVTSSTGTLPTLEGR